MINTAINIGDDNPIIGVGIGQFGFYATDYVEEEAYRSWEVVNWLDPEKPQYWPTTFALPARIYAETGIIGIAIWSLMWIVGIGALIRLYIKSNKFFYIIIIASAVGAMLATFNVDTFIYYPIWIMLSIIA
ncbi:hypothetical protein H9X77_13815, partial [Clostridium saudiense]|nr:hypothetical protein [Clostridium saudiense]